MGLLIRRPDLVESVRQNALDVQRLNTQLTSRARAPLDRWHNVGDPGDPGFQSGWHNAGSGYNPAGFFQDQSGFVHFRGLVVPPSTGFDGDSLIFTLPAGYPPPFIEYQTALAQFTGAGNVPHLSSIVFAVSPNRNVVARQPGVGVVYFDWVSLDARLYRAA